MRKKKLKDKTIKLTTLIGSLVIIILLFTHLLMWGYMAYTYTKYLNLNDNILLSFIISIYFITGIFLSVIIGSSIIEINKKNG